METALQQFIARHWPDAHAIEIREFAPIAGGYSRETFRFDAHVSRGGEWSVYPMILRRDPPPASAILDSDRAAEHALLQDVRRHTSIPVSESYFVEMDRTTFGEAAMVIERARGSGEPSLLFNGGPNEDQAEAVATHLCELIAELHTTDPAKLNPDGRFDDPRGVGVDPSSWDTYMDTTLKYYIDSYPQLASDPLPVWIDALLYLRRTRPKPLPIRLLHGDFNPSNFLYEQGRVTALIDWENAHMGDPREDLGWMKHMDTLSNTNVLGSVKADGGFLGHYNRLTGFDVTPEELEWFRIFGAANIAVPVGSAVKRRLDGDHQEFLHLYLSQTAPVSYLVIAQIMGYPLPAAGGA